MKTVRYPTPLGFAAAILLWSVCPDAGAATATAVVSATVLGPAGEETASGAVTLSRIAGTGFDVARPLSIAGRSESPVLARFRVGGGSSAVFSVSLPESVHLHNRVSAFEVSGFRAAGAGRLDSSGASTIAIGADVCVPAGQIAGTYAGTFPVTISYN